MKPLERIRKAAPFGLPILASIAAVILLGEGYSVSNKLANYERLRADHESLILTVAEKRRAADEAAANLARITGDLNGVIEGMRQIVAERGTALKEIAEARAAHASTEVQRRQVEERITSLQAEIETKKAELGLIQRSIASVGEQLANMKRAINAEQAQLTEAQNQARAATDNSARLQRQVTEKESRRAAIDKSVTDLQREVAELEQRRKEAQTIIGEATTLRGQIGQIRREGETAGRELAEVQQRRTTFQGEIIRLQSQVTELTAQAAQRNTGLSGLAQRDRELRDQVTTAEVALQFARKEEVERRRSIEALNAELGRLKQETSALEPRQAALAMATSQLAVIQEQITQRQREAEAAIVQAKQLTEQITGRREEAALLDSTITTMTRKRDTLGKELSELERCSQQLNNEQAPSPTLPRDPRRKGR
jgi:chromosome segregation ATPase